MAHTRTPAIDRTIGLPVVFATLVAAALLVLGAAPADAGGGPAFVRSWSVDGPAGITTDADGNVYVSEPSADRVVQFDGQGNQLGTRTGVANPTALGVDGSGTLYVLDGGSVARFDSTGNSLGSWSTNLNTPIDLAVDAAGDVFILSNVNAGSSKQVSRFSSAGTFATSWTERLETRAVAVRADGTTVYTINRHFELGNTLTEILSTDASGGSDAFFNFQAPVGTPIGLATDAAGNVYATDTSHLVTRFGSNGSPSGQWGGGGSAPGQFSSPTDAAANGDRVFVADTGNNRVQTFTFAPITTCRGQDATVYLDEGDVPTVGDDVILGTAGPDTIDSLDGDDTVCALGGDDDIAGGIGDDVLDGGNGGDVVNGGNDQDHLYGGIGPDQLGGAAGSDIAAGGPGRDLLFGGTEDDGLFGGYGVDALAGNAGTDLCAGGPDTDHAGPSCELLRQIP